MNTTNNKKRKKSQDQIERIFLQLIQKKNIDEISVSNICELANLNRSTFYSNYIDIYDLAEKIKKDMEIEFAEFQISMNSKTDEKGYLNMFRYIKIYDYIIVALINIISMLVLGNIFGKFLTEKAKITVLKEE